MANGSEKGAAGATPTARARADVRQGVDPTSGLGELVAALPIGVYRTTPKGELLLGNRALAAIYGFDDIAALQAAARTGSLSWYVDPGRREAFVRLMDSWGEIDRLVSEVEALDGRRIWVSETARLVRDAEGAPLFYEGAIQDITDLLSVQRALRESERRFRDFAEIASDWFWEMDAELRFSYFSETLASEVGVEPKDLLGRGRLESAGASENDPHWRAHMEDLRERRPFYDFRYGFTRTDGRDIVISTSGVPVFDESGVFRGYRGVGSNVTEEARVQQSLQEAKLQAEFANRAKSEFIANVSHELRTPLNAILGFTDIMRDELFGPIGVPRYGRYLDDIHTSAAHLLSIINMILDLSKIESGKLEIDDAEIDPSACVEGAVELVRPMARGRGVEIVFAPDPAPPILRADERALRQMLLNLLSNAVKFSSADQTVDVVVGRDSATGEVDIRVIDRGAGIPADKIDLVTQPFGHSESSMSKSYEGSGLGLAITRRLIELHGGRLDIESDLGRGTTVRLVFPADRVRGA
ncbi:MAG: PAS domain-containing sensor histidine kinase [Alphaproteobacteria bacterium]|nr:PAS domain-containing sensor histidine kinase [Alphaproteobacteria bacterium]